MKPFLLVLALAAVARPASTPQAGYADTIAKTSEFIRQKMAAHGLTGVSVALVDHEDVVWQQGFGWADRDRSVPVTTDTVFHIGSVSKMLTTTAIMALVDEGKVELDAPVVRYLPEFRMRSPGYEAITVRMLLTHQSGIPGSYFVGAFATAPVRDVNRRMLDWLAGEYLQFQPGYSSVYTNNGFQLMEEIVAAVSGKSFTDFVRDRILEPLGMSHTGVDWMDPALEAALSKAYSGGRARPPEYIGAAGTGGFASTPGDLCRFLAMINGGGNAFGRTVLKPATVAEMNSDQRQTIVAKIEDDAQLPGLGWDQYADPGLAYAAPAPSKNGGTYLFSTQIVTVPKYNLGAAVTINGVGLAGAVVRYIAEEVLMAALEERYGLARPAALPDFPATPAGFDLQPLVGSYGSSGVGGIWDLRTDGSTIDLWARRGDSFVPLFTGMKHRKDGWFAADDSLDNQFAVRKMGGRDILLIRLGQGHYWVSTAFGERLDTPPVLSAAWKARLGKTWVAADLSIADYHFSDLVPALRITEREGRLVYEQMSTPSGGGSPVRELLSRKLAAAGGLATDSTLPLEPIDDMHAWVPLRIDCRDLNHLQVDLQDKQEWLRVGFNPTLWRPLDTVPEPEASKPYTASIVPDRAEWLKLPAAAEEYVLTAPSSVHWALYDENLQPVYEAWGGGWRIARPAGSSSSTLYLALYSITAQQAVVQRLQGRTFSSASGAMRMTR